MHHVRTLNPAIFLMLSAQWKITCLLCSSCVSNAVQPVRQLLLQDKPNWNRYPHHSRSAIAIRTSPSPSRPSSPHLECPEVYEVPPLLLLGRQAGEPVSLRRREAAASDGESPLPRSSVVLLDIDANLTGGE